MVHAKARRISFDSAGMYMHMHTVRTLKSIQFKGTAKFVTVSNKFQAT